MTCFNSSDVSCKRERGLREHDVRWTATAYNVTERWLATLCSSSCENV